MRSVCPACGDYGEAADYIKHDPDAYRCRNEDCRTMLFQWNPEVEQ